MDHTGFSPGQSAHSVTVGDTSTSSGSVHPTPSPAKLQKSGAFAEDRRAPAAPALLVKSKSSKGTGSRKDPVVIESDHEIEEVDSSSSSELEVKRKAVRKAREVAQLELEEIKLEARISARKSKSGSQHSSKSSRRALAEFNVSRLQESVASGSVAGDGEQPDVVNAGSAGGDAERFQQLPTVMESNPGIVTGGDPVPMPVFPSPGARMPGGDPEAWKVTTGELASRPVVPNLDLQSNMRTPTRGEERSQYEEREPSQTIINNNLIQQTQINNVDVQAHVQQTAVHVMAEAEIRHESVVHNLQQNLQQVVVANQAAAAEEVAKARAQANFEVYQAKASARVAAEQSQSVQSAMEQMKAELAAFQEQMNRVREERDEANAARIAAEARSFHSYRRHTSASFLQRHSRPTSLMYTIMEAHEFH